MRNTGRGKKIRMRAAHGTCNAPPGEPTYDGHLLLEKFRYGGLSWEDGKIHDPRAGRSDKSKLRLLDENRLKVRGCLWIFCGSQVWTRIE